MRTLGKHQACFLVSENADAELAAKAGADAVIDADPARCRAAGLLLGVRVDASIEPLAGDADFLVLGDGEITNRPFIEHCAGLGLPTLMGTGGSTLNEVTRAVGWFQLAFRREDIAVPERNELRLEGGGKLVLLHGSLLADPSDVDQCLLAMRRMHEQSLMPVGFEDRSGVADIAPLAVACGAVTVIREFDGGFAAMAAAVRRAETILGGSKKAPQPGEEAAANELRRRIVAVTELPPRHILTRQDVDFATPAPRDEEFAPYQLEGILGRELLRAIKPGQSVTRKDIGDLPEPPKWFSPRPPKESPEKQP